MKCQKWLHAMYLDMDRFAFVLLEKLCASFVALTMLYGYLLRYIYVTNLYLRLRYSRNGVLDFKVTVIVGSQE